MEKQSNKEIRSTSYSTDRVSAILLIFYLSSTTSLQRRGITIHKPHSFSGHAYARQGVLEKPALFAVHK